jgi:hypothetical protein
MSHRCRQVSSGNPAPTLRHDHLHLLYVVRLTLPRGTRKRCSSEIVIPLGPREGIDIARGRPRGLALQGRAAGKVDSDAGR